MKSEPKLTRNETLVLQALRTDGTARSAYQILEDLRGEGLKAPPQVYRALHALCARGQVHRIESRNAFVACAHRHCDGTHPVVFLICERCDRALERDNHTIGLAADALARAEGFELLATTVEMRGTCRACVEAGANALDPENTLAS